jgi:hypothetical protein
MCLWQHQAPSLEKILPPQLWKADKNIDVLFTNIQKNFNSNNMLPLEPSAWQKLQSWLWSNAGKDVKKWKCHG